MMKRLLFFLVCLIFMPNIWADIQQGIPAPESVSRDAIVVCYDFGCKNTAIVSLTEEEWRGIVNWFHPKATNPAQERVQIKQAIGWLEVLIGRHTPTHKDLAFDLPATENVSDLFPGQQDCIDEAFNTSTYLKLMVQEGLIKHHKVIKQAYRRALLNQHWAGHIEELQTSKRYVVDSWYQPNGYLPIIQKSEEWYDITVLSAVIDTSEREGKSQKKPFWLQLFSA